MICPSCGSRATGQVGPDQYYCWDCCVEWQAASDGQSQIFLIGEEGDLIPFADPAEGG